MSSSLKIVIGKIHDIRPPARHHRNKNIFGNERKLNHSGKRNDIFEI